VLTKEDLQHVTALSELGDDSGTLWRGLILLPVLWRKDFRWQLT